MASFDFSAFKKEMEDCCNSVLEKQLPCNWTQIDYGVWETGCGEMTSFEDGDPEENKYKYCPYCGRKIRVSYE